MTADELLSRLDGVRKAGHGKWMARCPAHDDGRPSLSIREGDAGSLLLHCFAGCSVHKITAVLGVELSDLFPPRDLGSHAARPRASSLTPLVATFERDVLIVHLLLSDLAGGRPIAECDRASAKASATRLWDAVQEARRVC